MDGLLDTFDYKIFLSVYAKLQQIGLAASESQHNGSSATSVGSPWWMKKGWGHLLVGVSNLWFPLLDNNNNNDRLTAFDPGQPG